MYFPVNGQMLFKKKKIFIYLFAQVLVAARGIFVAACRVFAVFAACGI